MAEQLTTLTKAVAVALDIAGRPDTDDAYALNSVRKAYSLLNGGRFQDFVEGTANTTEAHYYGFDWMEAYRLEAAKCDALSDTVRKLEDEISQGQADVCSESEQVSPSSMAGTSDQFAATSRTKRGCERILAALGEGDCTGQDLSRITNAHVRTIQRRLKDLIAAGLVEQATDGLSPLYTLTKPRN